DGGSFGPLTANYIQTHWCSGQVGGIAPPPIQVQCPNPPTVPTSPQCGGSWQKIMDSHNCHVGWTCTAPQVTPTAANPNPDQAPRIASIVGPNSLNPGQTGSWKVTDSDTEHESFT